MTLQVAEQLELPPRSRFPVSIFGALKRGQATEIAAFPRIEEWAWKTLKAHGRVVPTEALLFELIQELMLTEDQSIGDMIIQVAPSICDYTVDYWTWLQFVEEFALCCPHLVIFPIAIAHPRLFRQQKANTDINEDIVSILVSSFFCRDVCESPKCSHLIKTLGEYLNQTKTLGITDAISCAFETATPEDMLMFDSTFPVTPATLNFIALVCATSIARYLSYPTDLNLDFDMLAPMRELASNDDTECVVHCVLALIVKWTVVSLKLGTLTSDTLERIRAQLLFKVPRPFGEAMLTKERVDIARAQLANFAKLL